VTARAALESFVTADGTHFTVDDKNRPASTAIGVDLDLDPNPVAVLVEVVDSDLIF
jgi:hypothetical protein